MIRWEGQQYQVYWRAVRTQGERDITPLECEDQIDTGRGEACLESEGSFVMCLELVSNARDGFFS